MSNIKSRPCSFDSLKVQAYEKTGLINQIFIHYFDMRARPIHVHVNK